MRIFCRREDTSLFLHEVVDCSEVFVYFRKYIKIYSDRFTIFTYLSASIKIETSHILKYQSHFSPLTDHRLLSRRENMAEEKASKAEGLTEFLTFLNGQAGSPEEKLAKMSDFQVTEKRKLAIVWEAQKIDE